MSNDLDTPAIRNGAVQYVKCPTCGAEPGRTCRLGKGHGNWSDRNLRGFAHVGRRIEYADQWQDIYGPATESWEMSVEDPHKVKILEPCALPRPHCATCSQCECGALLADHVEVRKRLAKEEAAPKKSSADVDDLLG